jgi:anti-anti-sigma factor
LTFTPYAPLLKNRFFSFDYPLQPQHEIDWQEIKMTHRPHPVAIKQLPQVLDAKQARLFFNELECHMNVDRPRVVLDCSAVRQMDAAAVYLLLCCLEEAMKRNGDVRLAAVPKEARPLFELNGAVRLFEIFDTTADAAKSFHQPPTHTLPNVGIAQEVGQSSGNAA